MRLSKCKWDCVRGVVSRLCAIACEHVCVLECAHVCDSVCVLA